MKLVDRQPVPGTMPTIYIGHRPYRDKQTGRQKVSRRWYAEYCLDGQRKYEPLRTTNKNVAIRAAHEIINRIQSGKARPPGRRVRIEDLIPDYLNLVRSKGRAPRTLEKYEYVLDQFVKWSKQCGIVAAGAFTEAHFWQFNQHMTDAKLAEPTRYDRLIIVKQLFKWAARTNQISANPLLGIAMHDPESPVQPCFAPGQVADLLEKADPHEGAIFACFAYTGMRFGEVCELRWEDLLLDEGGSGFVMVRRGGSAHSTKGRRMRRIPIHPILRKVFNRQPRTFDRVFTARPSRKHPNGGGPIDERRLLRSLKRLCKRCGLVNPTQYKLHTFRHAFASMCARNNVSFKYALEWMGHKNSDILDLYYTMFDETAEAAIRTIQYETQQPATPPAA